VSVSVQGETNALEDPVGNVLCGVEIRFENKADTHRVPSQGGCVHGSPEGVLKAGSKEEHLVLRTLRGTGDKNGL